MSQSTRSVLWVVFEEDKFLYYLDGKFETTSGLDMQAETIEAIKLKYRPETIYVTHK